MDTERRKVARRLRGDLEDARSSGHYCSDSETVRYICDTLGLRCSRCPHPWAGLEALADLIEPSCDRDALLTLADDMERSRSRCDFCVKHGECDWADETMCLESMMDDYVRCIREALGVQDV